MKNTDYIIRATSVARRGGSGSFAAGGGDASPGNSRLGQRPAGPEAEAVMKKAGGSRTGPAGLDGRRPYLKRSIPWVSRVLETSNKKHLRETGTSIYFQLRT